jgi:hypothetical protein
MPAASTWFGRYAETPELCPCLNLPRENGELTRILCPVKNTIVKVFSLD